MEKAYAQSLRRALVSKQAEQVFFDAFLKHLREAGRMKLLPAILRELRSQAAREEKKAPYVEAASENEKEAAIAGASKAGISVADVSINPSLIRGWRARKDGVLIDRSAKQALVSLYYKITN